MDRQLMTAISSHREQWLVVILLVLFIVLAGCRRFANIEPTERPTQTPTPRSTHLPPVPTEVPIGSEDNPIRVIFTLTESGRSEGAITAAAEELQPELIQATGLSLEVEVVETDAEALAQLCASTPEQVSIVWVGGVAYAAAYAQNCGSAELQVARGERDSAQTGTEVALYGNVEAGVASLGALAGKTVCRLGFDDLYTWLIPTVMMRSAESDVLSDIRDVQDVDDLDALMDGLTNGDCDAAGMSIPDFEERASVSVRSDIAIIAQSVEIPYTVLVVPPHLPFGHKNAIIDAFITIANGARGDLMRPLVLQDEVVRTEDADFARLRAFFSQANIDLAELGL